jgi:hypothetical protein
MTTISCSSNCKHQQDGICTLENAAINFLSADSDCAFFEEKAGKADNKQKFKSEKEMLL